MAKSARKRTTDAPYQVVARIPAELADALKREAANENRSLNGQLIHILQERYRDKAKK